MLNLHRRLGLLPVMLCPNFYHHDYVKTEDWVDGLGLSTASCLSETGSTWTTEI